MFDKVKSILLNYANITDITEHSMLEADLGLSSFDVLSIVIENELNLCFNRSDINPDYMKTLIFAAAAERYTVLPDPTPAHDMEVLRQRLGAHPVTENDLRELLAKAVRAIRIGGPDYIELELTNGQIIGKEQNI